MLQKCLGVTISQPSGEIVEMAEQENYATPPTEMRTCATARSISLQHGTTDERELSAHA